MTSDFSSSPFSALIRRLICRVLPPFLALAVISPIARAQDSGAAVRTMARDLAGQGAEAFEHQDYKTALDRFDRAYTLVPVPSIVIMQARSLAKLGRILEALDKYEKTQRMPLTDDAPDAFKQAVSDARREGEELWRHVPRLTIHVRVSPVSPNDLTVLLDSRQLPGALLDISQPTDPGPHEISVKAAGYETETRSVTLEVGDRVTLDIPLVAQKQVVKPLPLSPSSSLSDRSNLDSGAAIRPWAWTAVGVGTAGLALSAITGIIALEKKSALDTQCRPGCPASSANDISTFRTTRTLSYASLLVGSASIGLGGYFLLTGPAEQRTIGATLSPNHVGVWGNF
jgi:hypothetical protein